MEGEGEIYDVGSDVNGVFSDEFREFLLREKHLLCRKCESCVHGYSRTLCLFEKEHEPADGLTLAYRPSILSIRKSNNLPQECLIQFWRAEEVVVESNSIGDGERRFQLTTRNQPFLLSGFYTRPLDEGLCHYRIHTHDVVIDTGDVGGGGVIGRVFRNNRLEYSPSVSYYSSKEYPQLYMALNCKIGGSLVVPLSDSSGRVIALIQFLSTSHLSNLLDLSYLFSGVWLNRPETELKWLDPCKDLCGQYVSQSDSLHNAVSEIKEVIAVIGRRGDIHHAQTWLLCKLCNSLSTSERLDHELGCSYWTSFFMGSYFRPAESNCVLKKGEGVVGKAAESSHNLVYCEDIAEFSIAEYPLAHFADEIELSACFAITLRSDKTGDQVYVLEFFLGSSYVKGKDLRGMLVPILDIMRQSFRTFKVAFGGEEIGDKLHVRVIHAYSTDTLETLEIGELNSIDNHTPEMDFIDNEAMDLASGVPNTVSLQEAVHDEDTIGNGEIMDTEINEIDIETASLQEKYKNGQTSTDEPGRELPSSVVNVVHTVENIVGASDECIANSTQLPQKRVGYDISPEELMGVSGMKREDAAKNLGVSLSTFKRVCKHHKIDRWPPRKRNIDHRPCSSNSAQTASTKKLGGTVPAMENESIVTIKAKYGDDYIKFQLSASSGIDAFHHEVSKRLDLEAKYYTVKYQDEDNDWIKVVCNDDLRYYISSSSTLPGKSTLVLTLKDT